MEKMLREYFDLYLNQTVNITKILENLVGHGTLNA
jgi:hypothetical protein